MSGYKPFHAVARQFIAIGFTGFCVCVMLIPLKMEMERIMKRHPILISVMMAAVISCGCLPECAQAQMSFESLQKGKMVPLGAPQYMKASDGIDLAYFVKHSAQKPIAALIFLHGGGAYSEAGYENLASGLSEKYATTVYLMDVRGHGRSGGPRGDAPTIEQVWDDIKVMVETVQMHHPGVPLYLGGHSSGAGLVLNYVTWNKKTPVDGYFMIAPQLGYKSETARPDLKTSFATPRLRVFTLSALTGGKLFAHTPAVDLHYPASVLKEKPLMLTYYTRTMSLAITPDHPQEQFAKIDKRFGLFIGEQDDLFVPEKVIRYADYAAPEIKAGSFSTMVPGEKHLSILLAADDLIGKSILKWQK